MNSMQPYQRFPGPSAQVLQGIATGQPKIGYTRKAQWGKYFAYQHSFEPLAASGTLTRSFGVDGSYDFIIQYISTLFDNGGAVLQTQVSPMGEVFEQSPIYLSNWGSGQHPEVVGGGLLVGGGIPEALARNSIYTATAQDRQTVPAENNIFIAYHGAKVARAVIVPERRYAVVKGFKYPATFDAFTFTNAGTATGPIPAGQTRIFNISVDNEGDFDVKKLSIVSDSTCAVQITSDSDNWFLSPLRSDLIGGSLLETMPTTGQFSGDWQFQLPAPRLITAAGYIQVTVTNLDAQNDNRVQVVFHGLRCYPAGGLT